MSVQEHGGCSSALTAPESQAENPSLQLLADPIAVQGRLLEKLKQQTHLPLCPSDQPSWQAPECPRGMGEAGELHFLHLGDLGWVFQQAEHCCFRRSAPAGSVQGLGYAKGGLRAGSGCRAQRDSRGVMGGNGCAVRNHIRSAHAEG